MIIQIGSIVTMTAFVESTKHDNQRKLRRFECAPTTCVYLGKSILHEGKIMGGGVEWDTGAYEPKWLSVEKSITVAVVQPLNEHGRYRLPFRAFLEDVQPCQPTQK